MGQGLINTMGMKIPNTKSCFLSEVLIIGFVLTKKGLENKGGLCRAITCFDSP